MMTSNPHAIVVFSDFSVFNCCVYNDSVQHLRITNRVTPIRTLSERLPGVVQA